jgi:pentatricopeptide repeat protein
VEGVAGGKERTKRWGWICYTEESIMLQRLAVLLQQQSSCKGVVAAAFWSARHLHSVLQAETSVNKAASSEINNKPRRIDSLARQVSWLIKQNKEDVATGLLPQMAAQERPPTVVYCNYLLNSCARARNPTMAKEVYRFMKRNGLKMDAISYGCFLRTLSRSGLLHEALELLEVLARSKEEDVKANIIMYNTVLNGCGLAKSKEHTDRCLQLMEKHGVHKDEMSYVELIKVLSHTYTTTNFLTLIAPMCTICMLTTVSCWLQMLKTSEEFVLLVWGSFQVSCVTQRQCCIGGMSSLRMGHQVHHPTAP